MLRNVLNDPLCRSRILHFGIAVSPVAAVVQSVPGRTQIGARLGRVAMLAKPVADSDFVVPNRLEEVDLVVFGRALPSRLDDEGAVFEILQPQCRFGFDDVQSSSLIRWRRACLIVTSIDLIRRLYAAYAFGASARASCAPTPVIA